MLNTSPFFVVLWILFFAILIPFGVSRFFKQKRTVIYFVMFFVSVFIMQQIESSIGAKVKQQFYTMNKTLTGKKVKDGK